MGIKENVAQVQERIAGACRRSGRRREDVTLVAISKTFPPERIREAYEAGLREFGENRVQEAKAKRPMLSDLNITWHLVGHLQSNKAKAARELFHWVHSVDSFRLAQKLDQAAAPGRGTPPGAAGGQPGRRGEQGGNWGEQKSSNSSSKPASFKRSKFGA